MALRANLRGWKLKKLSLSTPKRKPNSASWSQAVCCCASMVGAPLSSRFGKIKRMGTAEVTSRGGRRQLCWPTWLFWRFRYCKSVKTSIPMISQMLLWLRSSVVIFWYCSGISPIEFMSYLINESLLVPGLVFCRDKIYSSFVWCKMLLSSWVAGQVMEGGGFILPLVFLSFFWRNLG